MSKQKNPNIGMVKCPFRGCETTAAVRRDRGGKVYTDCPDHGPMKPTTQKGQNAILEAATIWGDGREAPENAPRWIAENWSRAITSRGHGREPVGKRTAPAERAPGPPGIKKDDEVPYIPRPTGPAPKKAPEPRAPAPKKARAPAPEPAQPEPPKGPEKPEEEGDLLDDLTGW